MTFTSSMQSSARLLKRTAGVAVVALAVILVASWGLYQTLHHGELEKLKAEIDRRLEFGALILGRELQDLTGDLELIASSSILSDYLRGPSPAKRRLVERRFSDFANYRHNYDQIRLLGATGKELVRVNFPAGKAVVVPPEQLQDKSHRYYVRDIIALPPEVFYISPLDLNIEHGAIEIPFKPVIRIAVRLAGPAGETGGLLVLNYLAEHLLQGLDTRQPKGSDRLMLLNQAGYYLRGTTPDREWGFMLPERRAMTLAVENPALWQRIQLAGNGYSTEAQGLFGFRTLAPEKLFSHRGFRVVTRGPDEQNWVLLSFLPAEALRKAMAPHLQSLLTGAGFLTLLALGGSFLLARATLSRDAFNRQSRQLVAALENNPLGIVMAAADGTVEFANRSFLRITGLARDQVFGAPLWCLDETRVPAEVARRVRRAAERGGSWQGRFRCQRPDGTQVDEELVISALQVQAGEPLQLVSVVRDVSRELELEGQLRQAQKMEAVGQLASGVAHDFNNLLQVILGVSSLLAGKLEQQPALATMLGEVIKAGEKGAVLTRQLLTFSQRKTIARTWFDPNDLVAGTLKMIRRLLGERVEVSFEAASVGRILADQGMLEQALINLCINARDAMPDGGRLTIATALVERDRDQADAADPAAAGRWFVLAVSDNGVGIPVELRERVFEPFFTTKQHGKGTGLGLSTVYAIVHQHEGFIDLASREGVGTTFKLYLPLVDEELSGTVPDSPAASDLVAGRGETILLAEDDEQVRRFAAGLLVEAGYRVLVAEDGSEAVAEFDRHREEIALAILDVIMPGLNGRQVCEHIRRQCSELPVLFTSGYDFNLLDDGSESLSDHDIIRKPYTPVLLLQRIADALAGPR